MLGKLIKVAGDPVRVAYTVRERLSPEGLFTRYARLAREVGLDRLYLVLSFDCDIEGDIAVVEGLHERLRGMGAKPVYAVPGELLQRGRDTYRRVLAAGGEFLNHGYTEHTYFDTRLGAHASCFFYDQLSLDTVREDVVRGDACVKEVLGVAPQGFRAPHFGTFQKAGQLRFLHGVLQELDYAFSTSTVPLWGFRRGPVFDDFGVAELPVSGMGHHPLTILDSWGCYMAPGRRLGPEDYRSEGVLAGKRMARLGVGVLNYYADPCHIHDQESFFDTVAHWLSIAQSVTYRELLETLPCNIVS